MYVDKKLSGVDCVQTLSRLNRIFPGKETFILDFVNDASEVLQDFLVYYRTARLNGVTDPDLLYDLQEKLNGARIYQWEEVEQFVEQFLQAAGDKSAQQRLFACMAPSVERYKERMRELKGELEKAEQERKAAEQAGDETGIANAEKWMREVGKGVDELKVFRKNLLSYVRVYEFLSQIIRYEDVELEQLAIFAKYLYPLLRPDQIDIDQIDLAGLELVAYRLNKQREQKLRLEDGEDGSLYPMTDVGSRVGRDSEKETLAEIIKQLNEIFGADIPQEYNIEFFQEIKEYVGEDEISVEQIRRNDEDQAMHGELPKVVEDLLVRVLMDSRKNVEKSRERAGNFERIAETTLGDDSRIDALSRLVYRVVKREMEGVEY